MTHETELEPPRRGLDWGTRIGILVACALVVALAVTLLINKTGMFEADPGEPGWEPIVAGNGHGTSYRASGDGYRFQLTQNVVNTADRPVTIVDIRAVAPRGFTVVETGTVVATTGVLELDFLGVINLQPAPVELAPGADLQLVLRFDVECVTSNPLTDAEVRINLDVAMGDVSQQVEVPGVAPIDKFEPAVDLPTC